jgi:pimeloyl-ACP methyl ester carboxylesterase
MKSSAPWRSSGARHLAVVSLLLASCSSFVHHRPGIIKPATTLLYSSSSSSSSSSTAAIPPPSEFDAQPAFYEWLGVHRIRYTERRRQQQGSPKATVVLVHGFGASYGQFRDNIPALVEGGYDVYGLDLLGFGESAKAPPGEGGLVYSIDTWSDLVSDFCRDIVGRKGGSQQQQQPLILVGNSIGSLVCANLASRPSGTAADALVLLNCAGGMNSKLLLNEPDIPPLLRTLVLRPLLFFFDLLLTSPLTQRWAQGFFDDFRSRENVEKVLRQVYVNGAARVDGALVSQILEPAEDPGAFRVFCAILSGDPGPHPTAVFPALERKGVPVCFIWGAEDPWTPLSGGPAQLMRAFAERTAASAGSAFTVLPDVGHCPHDDDPAAVNAAVLLWLGDWLDSREDSRLRSPAG